MPDPRPPLAQSIFHSNIFRLLCFLSILHLIACGAATAETELEYFGPHPTLPSPNQTLLPTVNIAPSKPWPADSRPTDAAGLQVKAFATGLDMNELPQAPTTAVAVQDLEPSPALQLIGKMKDTLEGRAIGVLIADGWEATSINAVKKAATTSGATVKMVATKICDVKLADGSLLKVDGQLAGTPSVMFDAIAIILTDKASVILAREAAAIDFVRNAFGHLKAIGVDKGGEALLKKAGIERDAGVIAVDSLNRFIAAAKTRQWEREASVRTLA